MPPAILRLQGQDCSVVFDTRSLPIVFATWSGVPDLELIDAYFATQVQQSTILRPSGRKMIIISDCRTMGRATPVARKRIAELSDAQRELFGATMLGSCTVFSSALIRGVLTALSWLDPGLRVPTFATLEAAVAWAAQQLVAAGVAVPQVDLDEVVEAGVGSAT
ncbi:hypothetical protein ACNOYE_38265 [Nannocystaceae bacterium ST9]